MTRAWPRHTPVLSASWMLSIRGEWLARQVYMYYHTCTSFNQLNMGEQLSCKTEIGNNKDQYGSSTLRLHLLLAPYFSIEKPYSLCPHRATLLFLWSTSRRFRGAPTQRPHPPICNHFVMCDHIVSVVQYKWLIIGGFEFGSRLVNLPNHQS